MEEEKRNKKEKEKELEREPGEKREREPGLGLGLLQRGRGGGPGWEHGERVWPWLSRLRRLYKSGVISFELWLPFLEGVRSNAKQLINFVQVQAQVRDPIVFPIQSCCCEIIIGG